VPQMEEHVKSLKKLSEKELTQKKAVHEKFKTRRDRIRSKVGSQHFEFDGQYAIDAKALITFGPRIDRVGVQERKESLDQKARIGRKLHRRKEEIRTHDP
jgi:hypothetical protein